MNIYDFLCSPDIAAHCESIGHKFDSLEMAVIVSWSDEPLKQKIMAWQEIIDSYPDTPILGINCVEERESLHSYLREVIAGEEKNLQEFYTSETGCVYYVSAWSRHKHVYDGAYPYSTADKAWAAFSDCMGDDKSNLNIHISKTRIDASESDTLYVNSDGGPKDVYIEGGFRNDLLGVFYDLPMPFEKGDLVEINGEVNVLESLPHWWDDEGCLKYGDFITGKKGDSFDMQAGYYYFEKDGALTWEHGSYHRLRYFEGELKGRELFLQHLSEYMKCENTTLALPWLLNAFYKVKADEDFKQMDERLNW